MESPGKVSRWKPGWSEKKSERIGFKEEKSPMDLSSSGESNFFLAGIFWDGALNPSFREAIWRTYGIVEMVVDILLLYVRKGGGLWGYEIVSYLNKGQLVIIFKSVD